MRKTNQLTPSQIAKLSAPGRYHDGLGLYLQVAKVGGSKSWLFRYQKDGAAHSMGIGPLHSVSLAEARQKARAVRQQILGGDDPLAIKKHGKRASTQAPEMTFRECASGFVNSYADTWGNMKHRAQWLSTLTAYVFPTIGAMPISQVSPAQVLSVLQPLWSTKTETAQRLRGRIERILDWAKAQELIKGENPARWKGHLDKLLPAVAKIRTAQHHMALPYAELPAFMGALRARDGVPARALEFTILTAARTGEVLGAKWSEIDLSARVWTVPASRMKSKREHRVPLSDRAVEILNGLPRGGELIFAGTKVGRPINGRAMFDALLALRSDGTTVHGFRSTFRDWCGDRTHYPTDVMEGALADTLKNKVEAAYRRMDALEKRARLMEEWARYCSTPAVSGEVVSIRA